MAGNERPKSRNGTNRSLTVKRAMAPLPVIALLLGLFAIGMAGYMIYKATPIGKEFEEKTKVKLPGEYTEATGRGEIPLVKLSQDPDAAFGELVQQTVICWEIMRRGQIEVYKHAVVEIQQFTDPAKQITKTKLKTELEKTGAGGTQLAESVMDNWDEPITKKEVLPPGKYLLCCNWDTFVGNDPDVFLTTDITFKCD